MDRAVEQSSLSLDSEGRFRPSVGLRREDGNGTCINGWTSRDSKAHHKLIDGLSTMGNIALCVIVTLSKAKRQILTLQDLKNYVTCLVKQMAWTTMCEQRISWC